MSEGAVSVAAGGGVTIVFDDGFTVSDDVRKVPANPALIFTNVGALTLRVLIVKLADDAPAGTVTLVGGVVDGSLL